MNYDYAQPYEYAKANKLVLLQQPLEEFDQLAKALSMTQAQVDMAMHQHLKQIQWCFAPRNYSVLGRVTLAFWFLFGWRK